MKRLLSLPNLILLLSFAMLMMSCQKENESAEVLTPNVTLESTERICNINCTQCPLDFCCCRIEVLDPMGTGIIFQICGDLPGCTSMDTCSISAIGNCPEIRGIRETPSLTAGTFYFYCHEKDGAIRISNTDPTEDAIIRITCMVGDLTSMFTNVFIASGDAKTIYVDSDCEPDECN